MLRTFSTLIIFDAGTVADGFEFAEAGYFGGNSAGGSSYGFSLEDDRMAVQVYDSSTTAIRGCGFLEQRGLTRKTLGAYTTINVQACRGNGSGDASANVEYRNVGMFASKDDPTPDAAVMLSEKIAEPSEKTYAFSVSELLSASDADVFYIGGGVATTRGGSPGLCSLYISKIWLE